MKSSPNGELKPKILGGIRYEKHNDKNGMDYIGIRMVDRNGNSITNILCKSINNTYYSTNRLVVVGGK